MLVKAIVIGAYALMTLVIGYLGMKGVRSFDYYPRRPDRRSVDVGLHLRLGVFFAVLFIGFAGKIGWGFGMSGLWIALGNAVVGVFLVWALLGNRIRRMSVELQVTTMPAVRPRLPDERFAPFAMPQLVQKFYAIRDRRSIRRGMIASTAFAALIAGTAYFTGAAARLFLTPESAPGAFAGGKPVVDVLMPEFLAKVIPPSLSVLMMLLILYRLPMSTLAALVLISSSSVDPGPLLPASSRIPASAIGTLPA